MTRRALVVGALAALAALAAAPARAHTLTTNTARVTLRDGALEVLADVDAVAWLARIADRPSPIPLLDVDPQELVGLAAEARRQLVDEVHLDLDGVRVPLDLRAFPSDAELARAITEAQIAAQLDAHPHPRLLRIELAARDLQPRPAAHLRVDFPRHLGDVLVTFVQPATRLAPAGTPAAFAVLSPPSAPAPAAHLVFLAGALLGAGLAWRRARHPPGGTQP